ncbi:MAG: fibronectin type III domain-containing protein [Planctomycetota bacterium]
MNSKVPKISIWIILSLLFPLLSGCILFWALPLALNNTGNSSSSSSPTGSSGGLKTVAGVIYETIYGSVRIAPSGGVQILFDKNGSTYEATTASDGSFSISNVPEGVGRIRVLKNGYTTNEFNVDTSINANLSRSITRRNTNHVFISSAGGAINTFSDTSCPKSQVTIPANALLSDTEMELTPYITVSDLPGNFPAGALPLAGANLSGGSVTQFNNGNKAEAYIILPSYMRSDSLTGATIKLMEYIDSQWVEATGSGAYISTGQWAGYLGPDNSSASPAKISGCYPWCYAVQFTGITNNYAYVTGTVTSVAGAPMAGILVVGYGAAAITDDSGKYNLGPLTVVNATANTLIPVTAYLSGYLPSNQFVSLAAGQTVGDINFTIKSIGDVATLSGQVTNSVSGIGLSGAEVSYQRSPAIKTLSYDNRGTTGDITDDTFTVIPSAGVTPSAYQWSITKNNTSYTSTLYAGPACSGVNINDLVTEAQGQGMTVDVGAYRVGCNVTLTSSQIVSTEGGFQIALVGMIPTVTDIQLPIMVEFSAQVVANTNSGGWYQFFDVPIGEPLTVTAKSSGYNDSSVSVSPLSVGQPYQHTFTLVQTGGDTTPPSIVAVNPADNAQNIAVNSAIQVTFSEAMNNSTINTSSFKVTGPTGEISGQVSYNSSNYTAIFSPAAQLAYNTNYAVTVSTAATDLANIAITGTYTSYFTTISYLPNIPASFAAVALSASQIRLTWNDNSANETGFEIQRAITSSWSTCYLAPANTTWYIDTDLAAATTYYYKIQAYNLDGGSGYTASTSAHTLAAPSAPPAVPTGFSATAVSSAKVNLSWTDASNNEEGFYIERKTGTNDYSRIATVITNSITYTDTAGLAASTTYNYRIQSYNSAGDSSYSSEKSVTTPAPAQTAPVAPSGLAAVGVSSIQIDLSWTDNSDNELGFRIQRKMGMGGSWSNVTITPPLGQNVTTYHDSGLNYSTQYYYRVQAYNVPGYSAWSAEANATTSAPASAPPNMPSNLVAAATSTSQISLTWQDNSTNEDCFKVYYNSTGNAPFNFITSVAANATNYIMSGLSSNNTYYFVIRSYNTFDESPDTDPASATTWPQVPSAPYLSTPYNGATNIALNPTFYWTAGGTANQLQVSTANTFSTTIVNQTGITESYYTLISNLTANTDYFWRVKTSNVSGASDWSSANSFKTTSIPGAPYDLNANAVSTSQININWNYSGSTPEGFHIYRGTDGINFSLVATTTNLSSYNDDSGLTFSTIYYYKVTAYNSAGEGNYSTPASDTTYPPVPSQPTPGFPADGAIDVTINPTLTWTAVSYVQYYHLQVSTDNSFSTTLLDSQYIGNSYTDYYISELNPQTIYYWHVRATNDSGPSAWSATQSFTTTTYPNAPSALSVTAVSSSQINFNWTDASNNEENFYIYYSTDNSYFSYLGSVSSNITAYSWDSAYPNTPYWFKVRAYNSAGESSDSNTASATTWPPAPYETSIYSPNSGSMNVPRTANIYWYAATYAETYKFQIAIDNGFSNIVRDVSGITTTWYAASPELNPSTIYYCRVSGVNASGQGNWSTNTYCFTTVAFQPDLLIKRSTEGGGSYVGENIINYTGLSQTLGNYVEAGVTIGYNFKIQNDGTDADTFSFTGTGGNPQWAVSYYSGGEITSSVVDGTYSEYFSYSGEEKLFTVMITPLTDTSVALNIFFTATSQSDILRKDTLRMNVDVPKWVEVATGESFAIGRKTDGTIWSWGYNNNGQLGLGDLNDRWGPVQIGADTDWAQISAGQSHCLALKTDGTLWAWGNNMEGQLGQGVNIPMKILTPTPVGSDTNWVEVASGGNHCLARKTNGTLWSWGSNTMGQLGIGDNSSGHFSPIQEITYGTDWAQIAAGGSHSLARKTDNTIYSWGSNSMGQLGQPSGPTYYSPTKIGVLSNWARIAAGNNHTLAIKTTGSLWTWGDNSMGQLGDGTTINKYTPTLIGLATNWSRIAAGSQHTIAYKNDGTLWTWGANWNGQLGLGNIISPITSTTQVPGFANCASVSGGGMFSGAIKQDGTLYTWGYNWNGQLGHGDRKNRTSPAKVYLQWLIVSGGSNFTIGLKSDGTLWAWGTNTSGELGMGDNSTRYLPTRLGTETDWAFLDCGNAYALAIKTSGTLWAWGNNSFGQLGLGGAIPGANKNSPNQVGSATDWTSVSAGASHVLAINSSGQLWSWGQNNYGQLGLGGAIPGTNMSAPTRVGLGTNWASASAGAFHSIGVFNDGSIYGFGYNGSGGLGNALGDQSTPLFIITPAGGVKSLGTGWNHTAYVDGNGQLWVTGDNSYGQLGLGDNMNKFSFTQVSTATNWAKVVTGYYHTMASKTGGTLYAWGSGGSGQLGQGGTDWANYDAPRLVGSDTDWSKIGTGLNHSLAVKQNNSLWGWGWNNNYQLGLGDNVDKNLPNRIQ